MLDFPSGLCELLLHPMQGSKINWLRLASTLLLQALLFALVMTRPKKIWTDDFLHFAFGAYADTGEAIRAVFESIAGVNHGQTGFHMILNHLLLKWFGASYFVLRLPSGIAYSLGLLAGFCFLRSIGVSFFLRTAFLLLLGLSQLNLEHGAEARPYILLQASMLGALWAWDRYFSRQPGGLAALFLISVLGILSHPFFVAYLGLMMLFTPLFFGEYRRKIAADLGSVRTAWPLLAAGLLLVCLFFVVGRLSWFQTLGHSFGFDPYEHIGRDKSLVRFMLGTFFFPFGKVAIPALAGLLALSFWWRRRPDVSQLWRHVLFLSALLVTTQSVLVWQVLKSSYWLLQRQWIAGAALAILLLLIPLEIVWRRLRPKPCLSASLGLGLAFFAALGLGWGVRENLKKYFPPVVPPEQALVYRDEKAAQARLEMSDYIDLAHLNLVVGGPVWPVFRRYYELPPSE